MSNYSQITFFAPKDSLPSGNPSKLILGAQFDPEFAAIAIAIATKYDSASISTGPILFNAGTAALPSISFVGGTNNNTGIYLPSANTLGFSAGGVQRGSISSTGTWTINTPASGGSLAVNVIANNVGFSVVDGTTTLELFTDSSHNAWIKQTNASQSLILSSGSAFTQNLAIGPNGNISVAAPTSGTTLALTCASGGSNPYLSASDGTVAFAMASVAGTYLYLGTSNSTTLTLQTAGSGRLNIDQNGAVSINAPSTGSTLTTNGAANFYGLVVGASGTASQSKGLFVGAGTNSSDTCFQFMNQAQNTFYMLQQGNGEAFLTEPVANTSPPSGTHQIGYLDAPLRQINASTTLSFTDRGKSIELTGGAAQTLTLPNTFTSSSGSMIQVINLSGNSWSIAASGTLTWLPSGTTGTRALANNGVMTCWQLGANWYAWGAGIS